MKSLLLHKKNILKCRVELGKLGLELVINEKSVSIGKVTFEHHGNPESFQSLPPNTGLLLSKSSRELRKSLQEKNINYLEHNQCNVFIVFESHRLSIDFEKRKTTKLSKVKSLNQNLNPTNLISPNGLAFIDTIFRLDDDTLKEFQSTLQFCKHFELYQPKVSQIMKKFDAKKLIDFKNRVRLIPIEWWIFAFETPAARRKMTAFFDISQKYYSLDESTESDTTSNIVSTLNFKYSNDIAPGPIEVAKSYGEVIDDSLSIWVSPLITSKIKKEFKLIPGTKEGKREWLLASPSFDLKKAELLSHYSTKTENKTNSFRVLWDLGYGDARLGEVRLNILRKIIK